MKNLSVVSNQQRKTSVHLEMDIPDETQHNDKAMSIANKQKNKSTVNCAFTAYYGRKSPKAKRKREDEQSNTKKMTTFDFDPSDDPSYETETIVISEITENIKEEQVNELINRFSPVIRNFPDQIKKEMLECSVNWLNRNKVFIEAIKHVIKGREDEQTKEKELEKTCIERLSEILIKEIENRMPKHCRKCEMNYIVKPTDSPELHCMWCQIGMHDCTVLNQMKETPGVKWLCGVCEPIFNTHFLAKLDPVAIFEGFDISNLAKSPNKALENEKEVEIIVTEYQGKRKNNQTRKITKRKEEEQNEMNKIIVVADVHVKENNGISKNNDSSNNRNKNNGNNDMSNDKRDNRKNDDRNENNGNNKDMSNDTRDDRNNDRKNCWFFENRACKYGNNCRNKHQEICKQWIETGKCSDSRCKMAHPKKCRVYNEQGVCYRQNCWYFHPNIIGSRSQRPNARNMFERRDIHRRENMNNQINNSNHAFQLNRNSKDFLLNWPKPEETMLHQTITRIIGTMERVDARMENLERRQMNRWAN